MTLAPLSLAASSTALTLRRYSSSDTEFAMSLPPAWKVITVGWKSAMAGTSSDSTWPAVQPLMPTFCNSTSQPAARHFSASSAGKAPVSRSAAPTP